jgi:predicted Zn-dependent protease
MTDYSGVCARGAWESHPAECGCQRRATEFLAGPTAAYMESRRAFFKQLLAGGLTLGALPLVAMEARADIFRPSVEDQKRLGEEAAAEILQKEKVVEDERARRFRQIGEKLVSSLSRKERGAWDYRFRVIESKEVNAFALPGGNMFMYTGLYDRIASDDELAAVTGHEIAHVRLQHWANQVADRTKRELGLAVLLGVVGANATWRTVVGGVNSIYNLQYSRGHEYAADDAGLKNLMAARYNPQGMVALFQTLKAASGGEGKTPEFLRTHPLTDERIARAQKKINEQNAARRST